MRAPLVKARLLNWRAVARLLGYIVMAVAITAAAIHAYHRRSEIKPTSEVQAPPGSELLLELAHCQSLGATAKDDHDCEGAWAQNRRRFFNYGTSIRPMPGPSETAKTGGPSHP